MTTKIDIERKRGDTRRMVFVVKDKAGTVVNIGTWSAFTLTVDPAKDPADALNNIFQVTGALLTDGSDGKVYFVPPGTSPVGNYFYDVQALDGNVEKITIAEGKYKLTQDITKS